MIAKVIVAINYPFLFVCIQLIQYSNTTNAAEWSFPAPKNAQVEWVNNDTKFNGINLRGRHFSSEQSVDEVLNYYRYLWEGKYAETDYPPWIMLSHMNEDLLYTVQVKSDGGSGSIGILGVSDISKRLQQTNAPALAKNFPKMSGSNVDNEIVSNDPGKSSKDILIKNDFSVSSNVTYYKNYYQSRDWSLDVDKQIGFSAPHLLIFKKNNKKLNIVISRKKGNTHIVANEVTNNTISW